MLKVWFVLAFSSFCCLRLLGYVSRATTYLPLVLVTVVTAAVWYSSSAATNYTF